MVRRSLHTTAQFLGVLFIGALIALAVLAWRLSVGPVSLGFLTPYFEQALRPVDGSYSVRIEDTILDWSDEAHTLDVKLIGAGIVNAENAVVLQASELLVALSVNALLHGEIAPRTLTVLKPSLRVVRTETGQFTLGIEGDTVAAGEGAGAGVREILAGGATRYLTRVNVVGASVSMEDLLLGVNWSAPDMNLSLLRTETGISGVTDLDLKVGGQTASVQVNAEYKLASGDLAISFGFVELRPAALASVADPLAVLEPFDVPLGGTVFVELDSSGRVRRSEFNIMGGAGRIAARTPLVLDVPIQSVRLRGTYDAYDRIVRVDEAVLGFDPSAKIFLPDPIAHAFPLMELSANGTWLLDSDRVDIPAFTLTTDGPVVSGRVAARREQEAFGLDVHVEGKGFTFDEIARYWPEKIGSNPRRWIVRHMPSGRITAASADAALGWSQTGGFELRSVGGELRADGLVVDYLPPMPKVEKGIAHATFDAKKFNIAVLRAESAGLTASGRVLIDNLDEYDQWTDLELRIVGPLSAALTTLDSKPFEFASAVGLSPRDAAGETATLLKLRFIAENKLTLNDIKINATAEIKNAALADIAFNLPLSNGDLKLSVDNSGLNLAGAATIGAFASNVEWRKNFGKKPPFAARYRITTSADAAEWRELFGDAGAAFGPDRFAGPIGATIEATLQESGDAAVSAELELDKARLTLVPIGFEKPEQSPARAKISATVTAKRLSALPAISVRGDGLDIEASVAFASDGNLESIAATRFRAGETDVAGRLVRGADGWSLDLSGRRLDLKAYMEDDAPADPNRPRGDVIEAKLAVDSVRLYEDRYVNSVNGALSYDGLVVRSANLRAALIDGGEMKIDIVPDEAGRRLSIVSENAGGVLRAFDVNDNVVGGRLSIAGAYADSRPGSCLGGRVAIDEFRVQNAPILARLLNAAAIVSLPEVLRGEGIRFDTLRVPFTRKDGITRFENGKASGISMGFTASGSTNSREDKVDIEGSIIPANVINSVLGKLPVVGGLFGGDGGIFAINYKISGSEKNPEVTANPLTVLTPGFTRNVFSLFESKDEETLLGCPKAP